MSSDQMGSKNLSADEMVSAKKNRFEKSSKSIALVRAGWHAEIISNFVTGYRTTIDESSDHFTINEYEVPGVVEIPLFTQNLISTGAVDLVVVTGLIVDHGVYRHEFVAGTVLDAVMKIQLETGTPIIYGILTPQDFMSEGRPDFFKAHFSGKGIEAAKATLKTFDNERLIESLRAKVA
jgi:6,7-dimethyl-8-ribityllumazine synthase